MVNAGGIWPDCGLFGSVSWGVTVHGGKTIEIKVNNRMLPAIRVKNAPKSVAYGQEPSFIA